MDSSSSQQPVGSVHMVASQSPVPSASSKPKKRTMNRVEKPSDEQEEISKMAQQGVAETLR